MVNIRWSPTYFSRALNTYLLNLKEGQQDGDRYVVAEGVNGIMPRFVEQQFRDVRKKWGKNRTVRRLWKRTGTETWQGEYVHAYHGIISFGQDELDPDDPEAWDTALRIARATVEEVFPTRQAMLVLQNDGAGGCLHVHLAVNSVDEKTGRSIDSGLTTHSYRKKLADGSYELAGMALRFNEILEREGFQQRADLVEMMADAQERVRAGGSAKLRAKDRREVSEQRAAEKHEDWLIDREQAEAQGIAFSQPEPFSVAVLKQRVRKSMNDPRSIDFDTFVEVARDHRVDVELRPGTRGLAYVMLDEAGQPVAEGTRARRRASTLGSDYMLDAVEAHCAENDALSAQAQAQQDAVEADRAARDKAMREGWAAEARALRAERDERAAEREARAAAAAEAEQQAREEVERKAQRLVDEEANAQAEALVDAERKNRSEQASAAAAPDAGAADGTAASHAPSAAAPAASAQQTARSRLRDAVSKSEQRQAVITAFAAFEERALEALREGRRIDDGDVPKGIGAGFLKAFGEQMFPEIRAQMELREAKKQLGRSAFEDAKALHERLQGVLGPGEREDLESRNRGLRKTAARLRAEIAAGVYEDTTQEVDSQDEDLLDASARLEMERTEAAEKVEEGGSLVED
ncbi:relaxase/mobilization nuclease domain-containing protein [Leucobacter chromiireducens]|uniref:relaxase/mobilization nuclease domain-containing protein n=1 Tax=Leucobacter chromiireducens TaxID=283877 RepID=UPI0013DE6A39|nr:relaxase/mobilization nuclease domain-containing protein [Leucobacter chromiireducens]